MTERQQYGDEIKAQVIAALMEGQSIRQVAEQYHIPKSTVAEWKNQDVRTDRTQKKEIGELLTDYLRANLEALRSQVEVFSDKDWLKKQDASSVAVLHGVMTDKAIRLLEAMSKIDNDE
jgi:transposase-like protein